MLLSALSALAGMLPYILIWLIVRELLEHGEITSSGNVVTYAWWAAGMAVASIVLYFAALMSSIILRIRPLVLMSKKPRGIRTIWRMASLRKFDSTRKAARCEDINAAK